MNSTPKRIAALLCVLIILSLIVATLVIAILDFPGKEALFAACLMAIIGLPILLWLLLWSIGKLKQKQDPSSPEN